MASGYPGYPGYLLPFFMGKMLLIIYNIIKLLYIPQFSEKNTRGVTAVTEVTRGMIARNPNQPIAMSEKSSTFALGFDSEPNLLLNLRRINIRLSKVFFPALRSGRSAPSETVALAFGT